MNFLVDLNNPVVRECVLKLVGEEGLKVIRNMPPGEVTDERISEVTGVLLNIVRRTLFILYENRLASYRRERDTNSGWLTYLWTLNMDNIESLLTAESRKLLKNLETRLEFEQDNMFYVCESCGKRYLFETASESNFVCPACSARLDFEDNRVIINTIKKRIGEIESRIGARA